MRFLIILILVLSLHNCSFDQKSGIWKNDSSDTDAKNKIFKDFEKLSSSNKFFDQIIKIDKRFKFDLPEPKNNSEWNDIFFHKTNNIPNLSYKGIEKISFKSKKITRYNVNEYILYEDGNLIFSDEQGNLITYSIPEKKWLTNLTFTKKDLEQ